MGWEKLADQDIIPVSTKYRVRFSVINVVPFTKISKIAVKNEVSSAILNLATVVKVSDLWVGDFFSLTRDWYSIEGVMVKNTSVGELHATVLPALNQAISGITHQGEQIEDISLYRESIVDIPVNTTVSLVAIAVIGLVGLWFVNKFD